MFKNSSELLDCALREFQAAVDGGKSEVEIMLKEYFSGDIADMQKIVEELEIKEIVEILREEFSEYDIKSRVGGGHLNWVISKKNAPCELDYQLVWKSVLTKKE